MDRMARSVRAVLLMFGVLCALAGATARAQPGTPNYQGLWWAAPAGSQSGWGINLAHQGEVIFLTWFTYGNGSGNESLWMTMTASRAPDGTYSGTLVQTNGPSYSVVPFDSNAVTVKPFTAEATLSFDSPTTGTVTYQASSSVVVQPITMQTFGQ